MRIASHLNVFVLKRDINIVSIGTIYQFAIYIHALRPITVYTGVSTSVRIHKRFNYMCFIDIYIYIYIMYTYKLRLHNFARYLLIEIIQFNVLVSSTWE